MTTLTEADVEEVALEWVDEPSCRVARWVIIAADGPTWRMA